MEIYIKLFEVLFPVFFIVSIGYFLGKKNPNLDTSFITNYSANFGTPALILFAVMTSGLSYSMFADFFVYWLIAMFFFGLVGWCKGTGANGARTDFHVGRWFGHKTWCPGGGRGGSNLYLGVLPPSG